MTKSWATGKRTGGFTLIEVVITVGIVAILAAIAIPAYGTYVMRGRIPEATSTLGAKQVEMEQFFQDNRTYASAPGCSNTNNRYFDFSCTAATATAYTLRAVGKGPMSGFTFTVDQANSKQTAAVPSGWTQPSPNNCWVTKKGGQC